MLSKEAIEEFKQIVREDYGLEMPDDLVMDEATNFLTFFDVVHRPIKKSWNDEYNNKLKPKKEKDCVLKK